MVFIHRLGSVLSERLRDDMAILLRSPFLSTNAYLFFQVPERLYQLVDRSTDGLVTADQVMEFIAGLQAIR